jgi:hypothetical protein
LLRHNNGGTNMPSRLGTLVLRSSSRSGAGRNWDVVGLAIPIEIGNEPTAKRDRREAEPGPEPVVDATV